MKFFIQPSLVISVNYKCGVNILLWKMTKSKKKKKKESKPVGTQSKKETLTFYLLPNIYVAKQYNLNYD